MIKPVSFETCFGNRGCPNSLGNTENVVNKLKKIAEKENLEEFILSKTKGKLKQHNTFRIGISNCPNACSQVHIKDFGIIQRVKIGIDYFSCTLCGSCVKSCFEGALRLDGELNYYESNCVGCGMCEKACEFDAIKIKEVYYSVLAGGKLGRHPMLAVEILKTKSLKSIVEIFEKVIKYYKKENIMGERLGSIIQRKGLDNFLTEIKD